MNNNHESNNVGNDFIEYLDLKLVKIDMKIISLSPTIQKLQATE